jgi:transcriptional regulator with XRE-family HTH domain
MKKKEIVRETGARAAKVRKALKLSQDRMAGHLGLVRPSYVKYERGEVFPNPYALHVLATTFGISMDWLLANRGEMFYKEHKEPEPETSPLEEKIKMEHVTGDVNQLLEHMAQIPLLRYEILSFFYKFKLQYKELVEESINPQDPDQ